MILKKLFGVVKISDNLFKKVDNNTKIESPGMKYRHYAPNTKCVLVVDNEIEKINRLLAVSYTHLDVYKRQVICHYI